MAQRAVYVFEIKGIQTFLFAGGRLRDAVGASALVDAVAGANGAGRWSSSILDAVLAEDRRLANGLHHRVLRRAAGAFRIAFHGPDAIARAGHARSLTRLLVSTLLPGADWIDALGSGATIAAAAGMAQAGLDGRRGLNPVPGPGASPIALRAPRFGAAASHFIPVRTAGEGEADTEAADDALRAKQKAADTSPLIGRLFREAEGRCPFDLEEMFLDHKGPRIVGVVHADGNRLGALVRALNDRIGAVPQEGGLGLSPSEDTYADKLLSFSETVDAITREAVGKALENVVVPATGASGVWPARPLIQAGDDVLVLVRGDLAVPFAEAFLRAFARLGKNLLENVLNPEKKASQPEGAPRAKKDTSGAATAVPDITACAGIALVGVGQPFTDAHALAESLCKFAKRHAKRGLGAHETVPSALAFHRVTSSIVPDFDEALERDLTTSDVTATGPVTLTCGPYAVDDGPTPPGLSSFATLKALYGLYREDSMARGPLRELAGLAYGSEGSLAHRFARLQDVLDYRSPETAERLRLQLSALTGGGIIGPGRRSPLADLLALAAVDAPVEPLRASAPLEDVPA